MGVDRYWHPELTYTCAGCGARLDGFQPTNGTESAVDQYERGFVTVHDKCKTWMFVKKGEDVKLLHDRDEVIEHARAEDVDALVSLFKHTWMTPYEMGRAAQAKIRRMHQEGNP